MTARVRVTTLLPALALLFVLAVARGAAPPCATAADGSWVCLQSFGSCTSPCQQRCRQRFPASVWAWWREAEFLDCVDHCTQACLEEKKVCEQRRATVR
jgi:hypothetical protein